jgi:hypothetical protein
MDGSDVLSCGGVRMGSRGLDRSGLIRRGLVWQSRIGRDGCGTVNRGGVWYGSTKVQGRSLGREVFLVTLG